MWVKFTKTYTGPAGMFIRGQKYDLPEMTTLSRIDRSFYEPCDAPWDTHKDPQLIRLNELQEQLAKARQQAEGFTRAAEEMMQNAEARKADVIARAEAAKDATDAERPRKDAEFRLAQSDMDGALAHADLARITAKSFAKKTEALEAAIDEIRKTQADEAAKATEADTSDEAAKTAEAAEAEETAEPPAATDAADADEAKAAEAAKAKAADVDEAKAAEPDKGGKANAQRKGKNEREDQKDLSRPPGPLPKRRQLRAQQPRRGPTAGGRR